MANIYDMADTWNDGLTTFTAIKMDVTDTSSASGSLLMDLQVGTSSKFSVDKLGNINFRGHKLYSDATAIVLTNSSATPTLVSRADFTIIPTAAALGWGNLTSFAFDLYLTRKGTANLQLGAADNATSIVAQTLSVQSVASGGATPNIEGEDFTIQGSAGTGSGAGGSIIFQVAPAGGSGTGQNTLVDALTIGSDKSLAFTGTTLNFTNASAPTTFSCNSNIFIDTAASTFIRLNNVVGVRGGNNQGVVIDSNYPLCFGASSSLSYHPFATLKLWHDADDTLALRRTTSGVTTYPQTFNIYNEYTDATDFERGFLKWDTNVFEIGTEAGASGGTDREARFVQGGSAAISIKSSQVEVSRLLIPSSTGGTSLGAATKQWNNFYASGAIYLTGLPTSDPVSAGQLWNDSGTLKVSAG